MSLQALCPCSLLCMLRFDISFMYINTYSYLLLPHLYKSRHKGSSCCEPPGVACRAKGRCGQSALRGGPFGDMPSPRVPLCRPCHAPGLLFRRCYDYTQEPTKADCEAFGLFHLFRYTNLLAVPTTSASCMTFICLCNAICMAFGSCLHHAARS